jgi:hypothetical protein
VGRQIAAPNAFHTQFTVFPQFKFYRKELVTR